MPDDLNTESAEQKNDLTEDVDEALSSFMEDDDDHTEGEPGENDDDDEKKEGDDIIDKQTPDPDDKDEKTGKETDKATGKETGDADTDELEYPEGLKERLEQAGKGGLEEKPVEKEPQTDEPEPKETPSEKKTETPKPVSLDNVLDDLPDQEITVGDLKINLKDYKKDYPEDFAAIMAVGSMMANKIVQESLKSGKFIQADAVAPLHDKILDMEFWDQITMVHSDARKINTSKGFLDWLDEQDEPLQRLARNMEKPEDGVLIIDFYKKSIGKKKAKKHDDKMMQDKKQTDDLHKGTMRNKKTVTQTDDVDMNDAKAAFEEDDDDDEY